MLKLIFAILPFILLCLLVYFLAKTIKKKRYFPTIFLLLGAVFTVLLYVNLWFYIYVNSHVDLKRGSALWSLTLANTSIADFPVVGVIGEATFDFDGDITSVAYSHGLEYRSGKPAQTLIPEIIADLTKKGYEMKSATSPCGGWSPVFNEADNAIFYKGKSSKGECANLSFKQNPNKSTLVKVEIIG